MNAQMIDLRYKSGSESKGNNMNTQAQFLQATVGLDQASRDIQVAQQQLSQVLGFDEFKTLAATGTWDVPPVPTPHPDFMTMLVKLPQIRAQEAVVEQAQAAIKLAHSTLWPTLSLNYSKGTEAPPNSLPVHFGPSRELPTILFLADGPTIHLYRLPGRGTLL